MIDTSSWKEFRLGDWFDVRKGKRLTSEEQEPGVVPYIGAIDSNNGVANHIAQDPIHEGNTITLSYNGSVGEAFYQPDAYWATDDVNALYLKDCAHHEMNEKIGLFIATVLRQEKYRFSYGRKWTLPNMRNAVVKLPADEDGKPDWAWMEQYMDSLSVKPITTTVKSSQMPLNIESWKEFRIDEVFIVKGGFYNKKPEHSVEGAVPFLAATDSNNGVTEFYSLEDIRSWDKVGNRDDTLDKKIFKAPAIAVTVNGACCSAYYQGVDYTCSHDITSLRPRDGHELTAEEGLFCCTVIEQEKYRWSYGRKPHDVAKFSAMTIKLPADADGNPDWAWMEQYMNSLPYSDRIC